MKKERKKKSKWLEEHYTTGKLRENCTALEFSMPVLPSVEIWVKTIQRKFGK